MSGPFNLKTELDMIREKTASVFMVRMMLCLG
jgi:hypothetical protein